jgi:hypothetical protein
MCLASFAVIVIEALSVSPIVGAIVCDRSVLCDISSKEEDSAR